MRLGMKQFEQRVASGLYGYLGLQFVFVSVQCNELICIMSFEHTS